MKQVFPKTFSVVLLVAFCIFGCDETKDNSAKPKTIVTDEAQNDVATEDTEVAEGASFTVLIPAGASGFARLGKNKVIADEGTAQVPIRITLKRSTMADLPSDDSVILSGAELIKVEVTNSETNEFISGGDLARPLRIQTILRSSALPEDYYVGLWLHSRDEPKKLRSRTAIAGEALVEASETDIGLLGANRREFSAKDAHFTYAVLYQSKIDARFLGTDGESGSSSSTTTDGGDAIRAGSGTLALDSNFGTNGIAELTTERVTIHDVYSESATVKYLCGQESNSDGSTNFYVAKFTMSQTGTSISTDFHGDGRVIVLGGQLGGNGRCSKLVPGLRPNTILAVLTMTDSLGLNPQWRLGEIPTSSTTVPMDFLTSYTGVISESSFHVLYPLGNNEGVLTLFGRGNDTVLKRYRPDGSGSNSLTSYFETTVGSESCSAMHVDTLRGKITLGCIKSATGMFRSVVLRQYTLAGAIDKTWNESGASADIQIGRNIANVVKVIRAADDSFYVAGLTDKSNPGASHWYVARIDSQGLIHTGFGTQSAAYSASTAVVPHDVLFDQQQERMYFCGIDRTNSQSVSMVARLDLPTVTQSNVKSSNMPQLNHEASRCFFDRDGILSVLRGGDRAAFFRVSR